MVYLPYLRSALAMSALTASLVAHASSGYTAAFAAGHDDGYSWSAMNNLGDLAGYGATYIGGQFQTQYRQDLGWPDYYGASAINDKGVVGGTAFSTGYGYGVYTSQGVNTVLKPFNYDSYNAFASVQAVNNLGYATGTSSTSHLITLQDYEPLWGSHAFRTDGTTMTDLGTLGGVSSGANGINNKGEVVGWSELKNGEHHSFVVTHGAMNDLGLIGGSNYSSAVDINDAGLIIGNANIGSWANSQAYVYQNGVATLIGAPAGFHSQSNALNNWGQVVGQMWDDNYHQYGFMYVNGQVVNLNTYMDPGLGWSVQNALDINDRGQILANVCKTQGGGSCTQMILSPDVLQQVPALPVPEPETYGMLLAGLGVLGWACRRKRMGA